MVVESAIEGVESGAISAETNGRNPATRHHPAPTHGAEARPDDDRGTPGGSRNIQCTRRTRSLLKSRRLPYIL